MIGALETYHVYEGSAQPPPVSCLTALIPTVPTSHLSNAYSGDTQLDLCRCNCNLHSSCVSTRLFTNHFPDFKPIYTSFWVIAVHLLGYIGCHFCGMAEAVETCDQ